MLRGSALRTSFLLSALAAGAGFAAAPAARAQCSPQADLVITVEPEQASSGQPVKVTVKNVSTTCTYQHFANKLFPTVLTPDCDGTAVTFFFGPIVILELPPGGVVSQTWMQTDTAGQQVQDGTYAFAIAMFDDQFNQVDVGCPTVEIGPVCKVPPQSYGPAGAGTGGVAPELGAFAGELPLLGNASFGLFIANGRGGAAAALFLGAGDAALAAPFGTFLLDPNLPMFAVVTSLSGAPGAPGAGGISFPAPIPADPALLGAQLYLQALIADPEAQGGIAHTRGLTFALCQ